MSHDDKPILLDASQWSIGSIEERLGNRLLVPSRDVVRVTHLDTFDWRIHSVGGQLTAEDRSRRMVVRWSDASTKPYTLPVARMPRLIADIPPGFLHDTLEPVIEIRALLPMGSYRSERTAMRVVDEHGNIVVRLDLEEIEILDSEGEPSGATRRILALQPVPGRLAEAEALREQIESDGASADTSLDLLREAASEIGRQPGDYSSKPRIELDPSYAAGAAVRSILSRLLETIEANVGGVIDDLDIEFLHDLRVATRRTRSALSQLKGVLPEAAVRRFGGEFKWLGAVTGPCRDLDVYLLEMDSFRKQLGVTDETLDPLQRLLERSRRNQLRRVRRALRSARFARLVGEWRQYLDAPPEDGADAPNAERAIIEVASQRIHKAFRRMVKRGSKLGDDPPAESLHRLRIDAKKLRYLLEFFHSLFDSAAVTRLVKELKQLQDILGGFNDMEVQQHRLHEFADRMIEERSAGSETLFAMGRLAAAMGDRQEDYRHHFRERFEIFASDDSRRLYGRLFGGRST